MNRIFLLSPANSSGVRAGMVLNERAQFDLAVRLRQEGAALGDVYSFISGLYFRGKSAYSRAFAAPPAGVEGALVITPGHGLLPLHTHVHLQQLRDMATVPIDLSNALYLEALVRDARGLAGSIEPDCEVVLLGSIATSKYLEPLLEIFGSRLLFPSEFVGRGDMSRGGLMLRCVRDRTELSYVPAVNALRRGKRPAKLDKWLPEPGEL